MEFLSSWRPSLPGRRARLLVAPVLIIVASSSPAHAQTPGGILTGAARLDVTDGEVSAHLFELDETGKVVERGLPEAVEPARPLVPLSPVTTHEIASRLQRADAARAADLADAAHARGASRLVPEDFTRRARLYHVAVEQYTDAAFAALMARVGQAEGFSVVARLAPGSGWAEQLRDVPNLTLTELPGVQYVWTEDVTEIGIDGTFHMTARMGDRALLRRALFVDRMQRYYSELTPAQLEEVENLPAVPGGPPGELPLDLMRRFPDTLFMIQGLVERDGGQAVAAAIAEARGAQLREAITYLEGGNILLGTLPTGAPYAVVGRDSAAVSRALLARHHSRPVSDIEVVAAMANDLGVTPGHLFLVEQPGVFHLDMAMTLLRPGTVLLNDALEAFHLQTQWLWDDHEAWRPRRDAATPEDEYIRDLELWRGAGRSLEDTIQKLWKYTERFARYEARTLADLQAAGLTVIRVPGRFLHPTRPFDRDVMNFLNGEAGTNSCGRTYFITQGGDPRAERYIAARLLAPGTGLDRLYLAPRLASRESLWEKGGTGCRVKAEGEIVQPSARRP